MKSKLVTAVFAVSYGLASTLGCTSSSSNSSSGAEEFVSDEVSQWMGGETNRAKQLAFRTGEYYGGLPVDFEILNSVAVRSQAVRFGDYELLDSKDGHDTLVKVTVKLEFEKGRGDTTKKTITYLVGHDSESTTWQFTQPTEEL